jgi:hypothetical protein
MSERIENITKLVFLFLLISLSQYTIKTAFAETIRGRLLDERYFPVPNISINISYGGSTSTDKNGKFQLSTDKFPYYLTITDHANSIGMIYAGLSVLNPELTFFALKSSIRVNTEVVKINFTKIPAKHSVLLKFVSNEIFYSNDILASPGETQKLITVEWPSTSNFINGKIFYLEKTSTSFEKYGEKPITITKDFYPQTVTFDSMYHYTDPGNSYITIYLPIQNYEKKGFSVYANFLALHRNSEILLNTTEGDIYSTNVLVPQSLSLGFRLKVLGNGFYKDGAGFINSSFSYPGTSMNINSETPPRLSAPQDKFYGVNENTQFAYEWGSGTGVYVVHFHSFDPVGDFYVVTKDLQINSPLGYSSGILEGDEFKWYVAMYQPYFSVDDFVKPKAFKNDMGYKAITYSETRTFRTTF